MASGGGPRHWTGDKEATCYVGNLDERAHDKLIYELFLQMGRVENVHLPKDRVTQTHQGYGFVEFREEREADYAAKILNGIKLFGKPLRVNKASADKTRAPDVGAELFIGNLDPSVDERMLYETFSRFGAVLVQPKVTHPDIPFVLQLCGESVSHVIKVARDENGLSKGYGFISFTDFDASDSAIEHMNGQYLFNRTVNVQYALKKDGKGERHGDAAERQLAAQARAHGVAPTPAQNSSVFLPPAVAAQAPAPTNPLMPPPMHAAMPPQRPAPMGFGPPPPMPPGFGGPAGHGQFGPPPQMPPGFNTWGAGGQGSPAPPGFNAIPGASAGSPPPPPMGPGQGMPQPPPGYSSHGYGGR